MEPFVIEDHSPAWFYIEPLKVPIETQHSKVIQIEVLDLVSIGHVEIKRFIAQRC